MKASELRLGNLVLCNTSIGFVDAIASVCNLSSDEIVCYHKPTKQFIFCKDALFEPIPLTEELLFKFGFEYSHRIGSRNFYNIGTFYIEICGDRCAVYYANKGELICFINSVHQLQNLFFALTGEELKIVIIKN